MHDEFHEQALTFDCEGETLIGVIARPAQPSPRGVLIIVGGPQYRAGSHRQFVLLARHLAAHGIASMRFDYRGMGDSTGAARGFEYIEADIRAAVDRFFAEVPALSEVVLWGLCDAASAAMFYAHRDRRVYGFIALNPWARTEAGEAKAFLRHYYLKRVADPEFWRFAISGHFDLKASLHGIAENLRRLVSGERRHDERQGDRMMDSPLPDRMLSGLRQFHGPVLLIISGNDLTAKEFLDHTAGSKQWAALLGEPRVTRVDIPEANHTFSTQIWRHRVAECTCAWVMQGCPQ